VTAQITIIVSTYDRPDALETALAGVLVQTLTNWRCLVIGDHCGPETGQLIARIGDSRIEYANLPVRCGEQAGPNSVGLALSDSPYLCWLNHDDLWLPDHLEQGLSQLAGGADLHIARAALAGVRKDRPERLHFFAASAADRSLDQAFDHSPVWFEPASAWLLRREAALKVGPWTSAAKLYRPPICDWLLRAWRAGLRLSQDDRITLIKPNLLGAEGEGGPAYRREFSDFALWRRQLVEDPDALRRQIAEDLEACGAPPAGGRFNPASDSRLIRELAQGLDEEAKAHFLATGEDRADAIHEARGLRRGHGLRHALSRRTGEDLPEPPDLAALIADARRQIEAGHDG
jgi:hypothetical protein